MDIDLKNLPRDVQQAHELIKQLAARNVELETTHEQLERTNEQLQATHEQLAEALKDAQALSGRLQHRLDCLLRAQYGRRSEKMDPDQLLLFATATLETVEDIVAAEREVEEQKRDTPPRRKRKKRKPRIPDHLERRRVLIDVPAEDRLCEDCGGCCDHQIGEEITEQMEHIPAQVFVQQFVRPKYACRACETSVKIAPLPPRVIEKGIAGPGLIAKVLADKYADHLPLYRQDGIFARFGLDIPRSTLCDWVGHAAGLLEPVWDYLCADVLRSRVLHTDDTVVPVLRPGKGSTGKGRLWTYVGDANHPHTAFDYTPNRSRDGPLAFLDTYEGYLQADAYAGYDELYAGGRIVEVACWAHVRRRFFDARTSDALGACTALAYIQRLYAVERSGRELGDEDRCALRQREAKPILEELKEWLDDPENGVLPRSPMGEAMTYTRNQWDALGTYVEAGYLNIDNNIAENSIRPIVLGRKNWLFAGSDRGGRHAAIIYSIIESCRRNDVNCYEYLRDVLQRVSTHPASKIAELAPVEWHKQFAKTGNREA